MIPLLIIIFSLSFIITGFIRHYSLAKNIIDVPNYRSSHQLPTPRGGGVSFVVLFLMVLPTLIYLNLLTVTVGFAFISAGFMVASIGFIDDHGHIPAKWRLIFHFFASGLALYFLGGMPALPFFSWMVSQGLLLNVLILFYLVWLINLFNFMDGINGIASMEAISVCLAMACIYWLGGTPDLILLPLVLAAAVAGFILWNFPFSRIFMGDAGSSFLGIILGALSIQSAWVKPEYFYAWLILMGAFIVDTTFTLLRRLAQGDKIHEAHCSHAYQHAAKRAESHTCITVGLFVLNSLWLFPVALLVSLGYLEKGIGLIIAYFPLVFLAVYLKAGRPELKAS